VSWFQIKAYLSYWGKKKYKQGDMISPSLAEELINHVFYEELPYYHYHLINDIRNDLLQSRKQIVVSDLGAGSKKFNDNKRSIRGLVKYNASPRKQGELIARLVSFFKPELIIELGTSLGIGSLYLALPNSKAQIHTIEGCKNLAEQAGINFQIAQAKNIKQHIGNFREILPVVLKNMDGVDMVYFDGHHDYLATMDYFQVCLPKAAPGAVFIFDDIYWSEGMAKAWQEITAHASVAVSFDLFRFGIVILNKEIKKQHYVLNWSWRG
jgi:predicted O-methyltransferase YrrM